MTHERCNLNRGNDIPSGDQVERARRAMAYLLGISGEHWRPTKDWPGECCHSGRVNKFDRAENWFLFRKDVDTKPAATAQPVA